MFLCFSLLSLSFVRSAHLRDRCQFRADNQNEEAEERKKQRTAAIDWRITGQRDRKRQSKRNFNKREENKNGLHWNMEQQRIQRDLFCLQSSNTFGALLIHFSRPSVRRLDHWYATMCAWLCARVMPCCACAWINMLPLCGKLTFHIVSFAYRNEMK